MIYLSQFSNKKVLVIGLGKTGMSLVINLLHCYCKKVYVFDDNPSRIGEIMECEDVRSLLFKNAYNETVFYFNPKQHNLKDLDCVMVSPGVDCNTHPIVKEAKRHKIWITNDIEEFIKATKQNMQIAITGTNGKSTTCSLIYHALKKKWPETQLGGNIGKPVSDLIYYEDRSKYVLELSSFQIELLQHAEFNIVGILNITQDHLDRYKSFKDYISAKRKIYDHIQEGGIGLFSYDCSNVRKIYNDLKKHGLKREMLLLSCSEQLEEGISLINGKLYDNYFDGVGKRGMDLNVPISLKGVHNQQNTLFAYASARRTGMSAAEFQAAIMDFKGLPHRAELVHKVGNINFINDSKATNSQAMLKSIASFDNVILIVGGIVKDDEFDKIAEYKDKIKLVCVIGKERKYHLNALKNLGIPYVDSKILQSAIDMVADFIKEYPGAYNVLLAPGAASLDQFKNFCDRGDQFRELVKNSFGG